MKTLAALLLAAPVAACGSVASFDDGGAPDASSIDASTTDPDAAPPRCDPSRPFGLPVALTTVNSGANDTAASLTPDELTLLFTSTRPGGSGGGDIYVATRTSTSAAFGTPSLLAGVNTANTESRPIATASGLVMYAEVNTGNDWDVMVATRASTGAAFSALASVPALNAGVSDVAPFVLPDHSAIYFISPRAGNADIYRATRNGTTFDAPAPATGTNLNSASTEDYPVLAADDLTIYFASNRPGGTGASDIWRATRSSVVEGFGTPVEVTEVDTAGSEHPAWVSADDCVLYLSRDIGVAAANVELFVATRPL